MALKRKGNRNVGGMHESREYNESKKSENMEWREILIGRIWERQAMESRALAPSPLYAEERAA